MTKFNIGDEVTAWDNADYRMGFTEPMRGVITKIKGDEYCIDNGLMIAWYMAEHMRLVNDE